MTPAPDAIRLVKLAPRWAAETGVPLVEIARALSEWFSTPSPEGAPAPAEPTSEEAWVAAGPLNPLSNARHRVRRADLARYFTWLAPPPPSLSDTIRRVQARRRAAGRGGRPAAGFPALGPDNDPDAIYPSERVWLAGDWLRREVEAAGWAVPRFLKAGAALDEGAATRHDPRPILDQRTAALRTFLKTEGIPAEQWRALPGRSLRDLYRALRHRPEFRHGGRGEPITFATFTRHFWRKQIVCKLPDDNRRARR